MIRISSSRSYSIYYESLSSWKLFMNIIFILGLQSPKPLISEHKFYSEDKYKQMYDSQKTPRLPHHRDYSQRHTHESQILGSSTGPVFLTPQAEQYYQYQVGLDSTKYTTDYGQMYQREPTYTKQPYPLSIQGAVSTGVKTKDHSYSRMVRRQKRKKEL